MINLAIFASHNGSGFDALWDEKEQIGLNFPLIITNNSTANVIQKAKSRGINHYIVNAKKFDSPDEEIYRLLKQHKCETIFLSGYMKKITPLLTNNFTIINSHPALLPKHGGFGMYGIYIHEAVIRAQEKESGVTIHYVNEEYDKGEIILQARLDVKENETAQNLEKRVKALEKKTIVKAIKLCLK